MRASSDNACDDCKWWKCLQCDARWYSENPVCWCCGEDLTQGTMSAMPNITSQVGTVVRNG